MEILSMLVYTVSTRGKKKKPRKQMQKLTENKRTHPAMVSWYLCFQVNRTHQFLPPRLWSQSEYLITVLQNTVYFKSESSCNFRHFQRKWCKFNFSNDMLLAGLNFKVCRLYSSFLNELISLLPPLHIYIQTYINIYMHLQTHWIKKYSTNPTFFKISLYFLNIK